MTVARRPEHSREPANHGTAGARTTTPGSEQRWARLQRTIGNRRVGALLQRDAQVISFDEPEVITGHVTSLGPASAGGSVATRCLDLSTRFDSVVERTARNAADALAMFGDYMSFPASAEAEVDMLGVATKWALREGFSSLWSWAVEPISVVPGVSALSGLVTDMIAECERAETAGGRVRARDWLVSERERVNRWYNQMKAASATLPSALAREFDTAVGGAAPETGRAEVAGGSIERGDTTITGEGAAFLNSIDRSFRAAAENVPTLAHTLQRMLEQWVRTRENSVERGGGIHMGGRIYLTVRFLRENGRYTLASMPRTGQLAAPEASRTADVLARIFGQEGGPRNVNDLSIRKVLTFEVEDEVFGFNDVYHTTIHYRDPGTIEHRSPNFGPVVSTEYLRKANEIIPEALSRFNIADIDVRSLTARG